MVKTFDRGERTVWVMPRDVSMLTWFSIVRVANSVRRVLGALNEQFAPVSTRRAQAWCARMETAGMVDRAQLGGAGGSLVWATYAGTGLAKPNLYRQTTRHEVAVAAASARYVSIFQAFEHRFDVGELPAVTYLCNAQSARAVSDALEAIPSGRRLVSRVQVREIHGRAGLWPEESLPGWLPNAAQRTV